MAETVTCTLGELRIREGQFSFLNPARSFVVPAGSPAKIGLHYDYQESSTGKERTRVAFEFTIGSGPAHRREVKIGDTPLLPDAELGFLADVQVFPKGEHNGRFLVEAEYQSGGWFGRILGRAKTFRQAGDFVLRVK
jgi:hypothetical protein